MIRIGEYPSVFRGGERSKQEFILGVMKDFITNNQCIIISCLQKLSFGCPVALPNCVENSLEMLIYSIVTPLFRSFLPCYEAQFDFRTRLD